MYYRGVSGFFELGLWREGIVGRWVVGRDTYLHRDIGLKCIKRRVVVDSEGELMLMEMVMSRAVLTGWGACFMVFAYLRVA